MLVSCLLLGLEGERSEREKLLAHLNDSRYGSKAGRPEFGNVLSRDARLLECFHVDEEGFDLLLKRKRRGKRSARASRERVARDGGRGRERRRGLTSDML
jgi:hypothetical protein